MQGAESQVPGAANIEIFIMQGKIKHPVTCNPQAEVLWLKQQLNHMIGVSAGAQKLIFKGKQLVDNATLACTGIKNGDKLLLVISSDGLKEMKAKADETNRSSSLSCDLNNLLIGTNPWTCSPGHCFLPKWVMEALGVLDGDEVEVEPLQPPLNNTGHIMAKVLDASDGKTRESLELLTPYIEPTSLW